jgi:uncharacterized Zn finger protein (UPF0148 family)
MNEAIESPSGLPITMATSHAAAYGDDANATVGRVTKVMQRPDGSAYFEADIANTTNGRDVAVGTVGKFVKGISIRGGWMSQPRYAEDAESGVVTADDMAVVGIDFTSRPGVEGAQIESANFVESYDGGMSSVFFESVDEAEIKELFNEESQEEIDGRRIREAVETALNIVLEKDKEPYGDVKYADPGYQKDGKKRYPINTAAHVRAAWAYINVASNASAYSSAQLSRIKSRIKSAAKKFDISVTEEFNSMVDDIKTLIEDYASMNIYNGAGSVSISGSTDDAGKLVAVAQRVAASAIIALNALDPDADGDIDLAGGDSSDSDSESTSDSGDNSQCLLCDGPLGDGNLYCPTCGAPVPSAESNDEALIQTNKEEAMTAPIEKTAEELAAESAATESVATAAAPKAEDINKIVAEAVAAALAAEKAAVAEAAATEAAAAAAAAATVAEAAAPQTFTLEEAIAMATAASKTAVTEAQAAARAEYEAAPTRKGMSGSSNGITLTRDDTLEESELAKLDATTFRRVAGAAWSLQPNWNRKLAAADAANGY